MTFLIILNLQYFHLYQLEVLNRVLKQMTQKRSMWAVNLRKYEWNTLNPLMCCQLYTDILTINQWIDIDEDIKIGSWKIIFNLCLNWNRDTSFFHKEGWEANPSVFIDHRIDQLIKTHNLYVHHGLSAKKCIQLAYHN